MTQDEQVFWDTVFHREYRNITTCSTGLKADLCKQAADEALRARRATQNHERTHSSVPSYVEYSKAGIPKV